ncbi:MAG: DUF503 domain-containing protein [Candidatus Sumerlaeota bacterium]
MHHPPSTVIGVLHVAVRLPVCNSLKEKRAIVKPVIEHLRRHFNLAVAEVDDQDIWRSAVLSIATISADKNVVESTLRQATDYFDSRHELEIVGHQFEIL